MILCDATYPCKKLSLSILVYTGHGIITEISDHDVQADIQSLHLLE
jgi:hypothetical protein